jgi:hypothetical protein
MDLHERSFIGRVQRIWGDSTRHATIVPLLMSNEDATSWAGPVPDPGRVFPERGLVFWYDVPRSIGERYLFQFKVEEHPMFDGEMRREAFQVRSWSPVTEVVDVRGYSNESLVRRLLTEEGFHGATSPLASDVLIWLEDQIWIGPIHPRVTSHDGAWIVDPNTQLNRLPVWRLDPDAVAPVELQGRRILSRPGHGIRGAQCGIRNWASETEVARTVIKRIRKLNPAVADALGQSQRTFETFLEVLATAELLGSDLEQEIGRADRVKELMRMVQGNADLMDEAVAALMTSDQVREELEARKTAEYQWLRADAERRVEDELTTKRKELDSLEARFQTRTAELLEIERRLQEATAAAEEQITSIETELTSRLQELASRPERLFAETAILRGLFPRTVSENGNLAPPATISAAEIVDDSGVQCTSDRTILSKALVDRLTAVGIPAGVGSQLRYALLSGAVPVVTGPGAYEALAAVAATFAGGRLTWIPVSGSIYEPNDLLGRYDGHTSRIVAHPGGLLDLIADAGRDRNLRLVVLDGFNRGATDSYLVPILESYCDATSGRVRRTIPVAERRLLSPNDPYYPQARVEWPDNVLLACVPASGSAVLPTSSEVWKYASLIPCDLNELAEPGSEFKHPSARDGDPQIYEISPETWAALRDEAQNVSLADLAGTLLRPLVGLGVAPEPVIRHYAAARAFGMQHNGATKSTVLCSVVPQLPNDIDEISPLIPAEINIAPEELASVAELVRALSLEPTHL